MCHLYITNNNAKVRLHSNRIEIMVDEKVVEEIPSEALESIDLFGRAQITTPLLVECLSRNVPVQILSRGGKYLGRISRAGAQNPARVRMQVHLKEKNYRNYILT